MPSKKDAKDVMIKTFLATAVIALPLGYVVGNSVAESSDDDVEMSMEDTHEHNTSEEKSSHSHGHEMFMVDAANAPQITNLMVTKDAKSGWNLMLMTDNFTFSPTNASGDHVDGEGHAHIYVDGKKLTRLYSNNYYLGELEEGEHTIRVTLNTNDHKDYAVDGQVVEASVSVTDMHHQDDSSGDSHTH